ncbi:hypothetical protein LC653_40595 [Nostoc sp. CHAB 5784]|uniref:hypothetical protein n=1 Tax=Nostoc mirabile TaxID=2907820 RepID=UPI001E2F3105|nr:hypothetical protein [Nostoc mirabile]MCC5669941.1 hypothetical protein [Nostoc mirabile CHAB5784]
MTVNQEVAKSFTYLAFYELEIYSKTEEFTMESKKQDKKPAKTQLVANLPRSMRPST